MTHTLTNIHYANAVRCIVMMLCVMLCLSVFMLGSAEVAYCNGDLGGTTNDPTGNEAATQIENAINQITTQIYTTMRKVVTPITICVFGWAGFQFLLGGNQGTEKARKIMIGGAVGLAIVIFAPWIGQAIATWFAGNGSGDLSQYNPL